MRTRLIIQRVAMAVLVLGIAAPAIAQQRDREQERRAEALRRIEAAQRELEATLEELRRERTVEAQRELADALRELQRAQMELAGELHGLQLMSPGVTVYTSGDSPQMGVYLDYAPNQGGARIESVVRDGPSARAGLRDGDIIIKANGVDLSGDRRPATRLVEIKNRLDIGDTLRVEFRRGSQTQATNIALGRVSGASAFGFSTGLGVPRADVRVEVPDVRVTPPGINLRWAFPAGWLDIELISLDEDLGRYFGTSDGLLVVRAPRDETLRLRSGDVILQVDGREPVDQSHLLRILRSYAAGETMQLTILRDKRRQTLNVTVPEREDGLFWRER